MGVRSRMLTSAKAKKGTLIAAHRGTCGGNIVQNTMLAFETALQHGADMLEIDVIMSKDGDFFAFHNGQEKLVLGTGQDIRKLPTREIQEFNCYNQIGALSGQRLERLEDILAYFRDRCLINIDRSWFYWKETIQFLNKQNMQEQILLKSAPDSILLETLEQYGSNIMYMPILNNKESWEGVQQYHINIVAAELIFETLESPLVSPDFMRELQNKGILTWVNAITLNEQTVLSAFLDDNHAITQGYEKSWGKLMEMGFDIIQTDWPALLNQYILTIK